MSRDWIIATLAFVLGEMPINRALGQGGYSQNGSGLSEYGQSGYGQNGEGQNGAIIVHSPAPHPGGHRRAS
jgi:hypothetical protein